jgi:hypothetical protein
VSAGGRACHVQPWLPRPRVDIGKQAAPSLEIRLVLDDEITASDEDKLGLQLRQEFDCGGEVAALLADVGVRIRLGREVADAAKIWPP